MRFMSVQIKFSDNVNTLNTHLDASHKVYGFFFTFFVFFVSFYFMMGADNMRVRAVNATTINMNWIMFIFALWRLAVFALLFRYTVAKSMVQCANVYEIAVCNEKLWRQKINWTDQTTAWNRPLSFRTIFTFFSMSSKFDWCDCMSMLFNFTIIHLSFKPLLETACRVNIVFFGYRNVLFTIFVLMFICIYIFYECQMTEFTEFQPIFHVYRTLLYNV